MITHHQPRTVVTGSKILGFRKLFAFVAIAICGTVLQILGQLNEVSAAFLAGIFLTYVGGNVREHAHRVQSAPAKDNAPPPVSPRPRPGDHAPFVEEAETDRTNFDPERPAVSPEIMLTLLAELATERAQKNRR
jgi:hypothetical protein